MKKRKPDKVEQLRAGLAIGATENPYPPEILEYIRQREEFIANHITGQLEDFRLQVLAQGHKAAPVSVQEGQHHTYFCPACKCGARLTVSFDTGELKFNFERTGSALRLTCEQAQKERAVANFKATALAFFEIQVQAYNVTMRRTGHRPDVGRLITMGRHDFRKAQYTTPAADAGQNEENDE